MKQTVLFGSPPPPAGLTARQARVLEALHELDRLDVDEAGAVAHEVRANRPHSRDERCEWCGQDGRGILAALVKKGRARRRRIGGRMVYEAVGGAAAGQSHDAGEIPW